MCGVALIKNHRGHIISGDFSLIEYDELTIEEITSLKKYIEGYDVLGQDLVNSCVYDTEYVISIIKVLEQFCKKFVKYTELKELAEALPTQRKHNSNKHYITAYTFDEAIRKRLTNCYFTENAHLYSIIDSIDLDDKSSIEEAKKFLKWCSYNISEQITELFDNLYSNDRIKTVIEARANVSEKWSTFKRRRF